MYGFVGHSFDDNAVPTNVVRGMGKNPYTMEDMTVKYKEVYEKNTVTEAVSFLISPSEYSLEKWKTFDYSLRARDDLRKKNKAIRCIGTREYFRYVPDCTEPTSPVSRVLSYFGAMYLTKNKTTEYHEKNEPNSSKNE